MTTHGIVADAQPFVKSKLPHNLKAIAAKRIKQTTPLSYKNYLQKLDDAVAKLEESGVFFDQKTLTYALKYAESNPGEISNQELVRLLLDQQRLQRIFIQIYKAGSFSVLKKDDIKFIMKHPAGNVRAFINKYQQELELALAPNYQEEIDTHLLQSFG